MPKVAAIIIAINCEEETNQPYFTAGNRTGCGFSDLGDHGGIIMNDDNRKLQLGYTG